MQASAESFDAIHTVSCQKEQLPVNVLMCLPDGVQVLSAE